MGGLAMRPEVYSRVSHRGISIVDARKSGQSIERSENGGGVSTRPGHPWGYRNSSNVGRPRLYLAVLVSIKSEQLDHPFNHQAQPRDRTNNHKIAPRPEGVGGEGKRNIPVYPTPSPLFPPIFSPTIYIKVTSDFTPGHEHLKLPLALNPIVQPSRLRSSISVFFFSVPKPNPISLPKKHPPMSGSFHTPTALFTRPAFLASLSLRSSASLVSTRRRFTLMLDQEACAGAVLLSSILKYLFFSSSGMKRTRESVKGT